MRAVVLLSGGIDSTVVLAHALAQGLECYTLSFDYGQRHRIELDSARAIAAYYGVNWRLLSLSLGWAETSSALLSSTAEIPLDRDPSAITTIAPTYVPARNTLFLAYALGYAEVIDAAEIFFGANADDAIPYPDCRPAFFEAFEQMAQLATRQGVTQGGPRIRTPLLQLNKSAIVALGRALQAPLELTFSCYAPTDENTACLRCDACMLRIASIQEEDRLLPVELR